MSSSNKLKSSVGRMDTDEASRKKIEENKQVFDRLREHKLKRNFEPDTVSKVKGKHIEKEGKTKSTEKRTSMSEENMTKATEVKENNRTKLDRHDQTDGLFDVRVFQSKRTHRSSNFGTAERLRRTLNEDEGKRIYDRKINYEHETIPRSYAQHKESRFHERSFSSKEERKAKQSNVKSTANRSFRNAEAGCSGRDISASIGQNSSPCQVPRASSYERRHNRYTFFSGLVRTASSLFKSGTTAWNTETMEFASPEREVTARIENDLSASRSRYGVEVGGAQNNEQRNQPNHHQSKQNTKSPIQSIIRKESTPSNTSSEDALEKKIKDVENRAAFSSAEARKKHFRQFFETMNSPVETARDKELKQELENVSEKMRMYLKGTSRLMADYLSPPYIVLLGDVGTGKSTIVEKLTGERDRSSNAYESFTRTSKPFWVPDGSLIISDTPGSNSMKAKLKHNTQIAGALNFRPVSRIFIVVKAETRIDNVVDDVRKYADHFVELPTDVVAVLVTHMDMVEWKKEDFILAIDNELGIKTVVFSSITTGRETLLRDVIKTCTETHNLTVNNENFLRLFKIHNNHRKILQSTSCEIKKFSEKKKAFDEARKAFSGKDLIDLVFEFQAYMADEIIEAQKRMAEEHNFTFLGDRAANEAGHVANMVNQLSMVLYDIRTECLEFQSGHGVSELRKCPYCGLVWTKVEGCDGGTTCGNRPSNVNDMRNPSFRVLGTFSFEWVDGKFRISKAGAKSVKSEKSCTSQSAGCGKTINWTQMNTVDVPSEFSQTVKVCTSDIKILPSTAAEFETYLSNEISDATKGMKLADKPPRY